MNQSEKFWDNMASKYDQEEKKDELTYIKIIEKIKKYLKLSDVVLDYGCGTGKISSEIAGSVKVIYANDISSKMLDIAKTKTDGRKIKNIEYAHSTIFDERYEKDSFDVILVFYVLHLIEDTPKVIQRINELLKPGGLFISVTPCMGEKRFLRKLLYLLSKIGLVPNIRSFKIFELVDLIDNGNFIEVETECLNQSSQEYFVVSKKI
ncbi:class I SAM-dependent methyltransferase [Mycoplasmatota bacterium zrk1]